MFTKYLSILTCTVILVCGSCKKIDNYARPNGGIYGTLIDNITKENLQSEQPDGFTIKLFEKDGQDQSPITFFGKPDGTYENAFVFQNEYRVMATEGAFFPVDTVTLQIGSRTEANFEVTPYLALTNVSVNASAGTITTGYQISRSQEGDKIVERKTLVSKVPTVNNIVYDFKSETDLTDRDDAEILTASFTDEISGLSAGEYYVRIATRTDNALKKFNYSKVTKISVP